MAGSIRFPHLGISLQHVIKSISIGSFEIACYGIVLAIAMVTGLVLVMKLAEATGQKGDDYFDLGIVSIVVAVICARIYYVVFSWDYYNHHLLEIINLREGGLAIYGGVIGGVAAMFFCCKKRNMHWKLVLDTAVPGLVWGQVVGRWGNFFNREAFGDYTDGLLAMQLPVADVRSIEITAGMREHLQIVDGVEYIQVHPAFLYESLWNLVLLSVLLLVTFFCARRFQGMVFLLYLLFYGAGRFWIEGLRTDQLLLPWTDVPVSQLLSLVLVIFSTVLMLTGIRRQKNEK